MGMVHKIQLLGCFLQEKSLLLDRTNQGFEARGLETPAMSGMREGPGRTGTEWLWPVEETCWRRLNTALPSLCVIPSPTWPGPRKSSDSWLSTFYAFYPPPRSPMRLEMAGAGVKCQLWGRG